MKKNENNCCNSETIGYYERMTTEQQIGTDLNTIDLIMAIGSKSAKRKASKHRKACFAEIAKMNKNDGLSDLTDDELLSALLS